MALDERHPEYAARLSEWEQMTDTYAGEKEIKRKRGAYLAPTAAMVQDGMQNSMSPGWVDYEAYLQRAVFHDVVRDAVKTMIGILHMKPATIKLPKRMLPLLDRATVQGENLHMLLRRINEAQFTKGRCGLLVEAPTGVDVDKALPYIAFYDAERVVNWDAGRGDEGKQTLELVVIDESSRTREGFVWVDQKKFRVLKRGTILATDARPGKDEPYMVCVKVDDMTPPEDSEFMLPQIGGRDLKEIPFVFIGANDLVPEPEVPPLLGLSNLALAIYRGEADYRQTLFQQGQQTLVIVGGNTGDSDAPIRVGAKGVIDLKIGGKAEYIGVSASGLGEMRQSVNTDKDAAATWGISFLDMGASSGVSGEALRIRVAARTTTISSVAKTGGAGLEQILKYCAMWMDADPDKVKVEPQTDFADDNVASASLLAFMQAKQLGLPLSERSIHRTMRKNDLTEMTFEEEKDAMQNEQIENARLMAEALQEATDAGYIDAPPAVPPADGETVPVTPPAENVPPGGNVPITPHTRGASNPIKSKVGKKGASAEK